MAGIRCTFDRVAASHGRYESLLYEFRTQAETLMERCHNLLDLENPREDERLDDTLDHIQDRLLACENRLANLAAAQFACRNAMNAYSRTHRAVRIVKVENVSTLRCLYCMRDWIQLEVQWTIPDFVDVHTRGSIRHAANLLGMVPVP